MVDTLDERSTHSQSRAADVTATDALGTRDAEVPKPEALSKIA